MVKELKRMFLGYKEESGVTWQALAEACDEPRATLQYRFEHSLLTLWEWKVITERVGMTYEKVMEVYGR